jgi:cyclic beta-1,2-glucan synthetase
VTLAADSSIELVWLLGEAAAPLEARSMIEHWRGADLDAALAAVREDWLDVLGTVTVKTPDRAFDVMMNGWLLYQTLACRVQARSAFYQASGAYGFRDQLQDTMALIPARPALAREHLLRAAGRQFLEGDVQHWWLPQTGRGVRSRVSDDGAWLCYCVAHYVDATGDVAVLDEVVPFLDGPVLRDDEGRTLFPADGRGRIGDAVRALRARPRAESRRWRPRAAPDRFGRLERRHESRGRGRARRKHLAWLVPAPRAVDSLRRWPRHAASKCVRTVGVRTQPTCAPHLGSTAGMATGTAVATSTTARPLGSATNAECRIDSIAQTWGVISGAADPERAARAMASLDRHLVRRDDGLVLLLTPPFDRTVPDPGYIQAYPPGIRENGGQYTHAATWSVIAFAMLGDGDKAAEIFSILNPINRALTPADVLRYKVEPYVVAADVYSEPPHVGRGGWTWYTGSAAWMYRAGLEWMLGCRLRGATLYLDPCIPKHWPGFRVSLRFGATRYEIGVENPDGVNRGLASLQLDGKALPPGRGESRSSMTDGSTGCAPSFLRVPSEAPKEVDHERRCSQ